MAMKVSVIIPAYNEEGRIGATVRAVRSIPEVAEVIVVNDGSADATEKEARQAGARVLNMPGNSGKGAALNRGIKAASAEIIVFLDGDLGATAAEARKLIRPILDGEADMTIARFPPPRRRGGFGVVKGLAAGGIYYCTGLKMQSPISGQRALKREVLPYVFPVAGGYGVEVGMTIAAARAGFRILEVPVLMGHRETGRDLKGFIHRGRQFRDIAFTLLKCLGSRNPARIR
ncbi:MAG: glycosyltransferase family 2 protein [Bacillota bacterium]